MSQTYEYNITLTKRSDDSIVAEGCPPFPPGGLLPGDSVLVKVNVKVCCCDILKLSKPTLLILSVYDTNTSMLKTVPKPQRGALVALWGLFQTTAGLFLSQGLVPFSVGQTIASDQVTFTNINFGSAMDVCFFGVSGTVQIGEDRVVTWCHDPEVQLLGGQRGP